MVEPAGFDPWAVPQIPLLSRSAHDRIAHRRSDDEWLARAWSDETSRVLVLSPRSKAAVSLDGDRLSLVLLPPSAVAVDGLPVLLGAAAGVNYLAVLTGVDAGTGTSAVAAVDDFGGSQWVGLRDLGVALDDLGVGLLTEAVALHAWHQRHQRCPRCGAATEPAQAGWARRCLADATEHFPRTDPAVIMLVHDGAGHCVLGRGPQWPPGRMSVLAGFVEAGESAEAAVAREVAEEVGIRVRDVRYVASQPHPFPASLMLGYTARLDGDPTLRIDPSEMAEAGWFSRAEVRRATDWGDDVLPTAPASASGAPVLRGLPSSMSIARQLINMWLVDPD